MDSLYPEMKFSSKLTAELRSKALADIEKCKGEKQKLNELFGNLVNRSLSTFDTSKDIAAEMRHVIAPTTIVIDRRMLR
jgi:hypothetical protein